MQSFETLQDYPEDKMQLKNISFKNKKSHKYKTEEGKINSKQTD
jgi:hypothetical protein